MIAWPDLTRCFTMRRQEQLTRHTALRELIVLAARPLQHDQAIRRLPLLVFAYRADYYSTEVKLR